MENNGILSPLFDKILNEPGTDPRVNSFKKIRNFVSREFNILRLEDLYKKKLRVYIVARTGKSAERTSKAMFWSC